MNTTTYCLEELQNLELVKNLNQIVIDSGETIEGNCLYQGFPGLQLHKD